MVDLQNDFLPGGALAVSEGDRLIPLANQLQACFDHVIATQDWHPRGHLGFASSHPGRQPGEVIQLEGVSQILWPDHCVQGTLGAAFHPDLDLSRVRHIVQKGMHPAIDSYSAFFDNARLQETGLAAWLRERGILDLYVMGIATDYCVRYTCEDALECGFNVHLVPEACRGVELRPQDGEAAIQSLRSAGVRIKVLSDPDFRRGS